MLIAGFGSMLHGDDGFGVAVVQRLQELGSWPEGVEIIEVGTGGLHLVQRLLDGFDTLVVIDTMRRDQPPGTICLLSAAVPAVGDWSAEEQREFYADLHYAEPSRALVMAKALNVLPVQTFILGCEPQDCEDLQLGLNPPVAAAVEQALAEVQRLVVNWQQQQSRASAGGSEELPGTSQRQTSTSASSGSSSSSSMKGGC